MFGRRSVAAGVLVAGLLAMVGCGDGEDRPGQVTADDADVSAVADDLRELKEVITATRVDWADAGSRWTATFRDLVPAPDVVAFVDAAIAGPGDDDVRAAHVEKGVTVLLARKVVEKLDGASDVHDVDEAWAYFTSARLGFDKNDVRGAIDGALLDAQQALTDGDLAGAAAATAEVREGLDYVFYLATSKYLTAEDEVGRAEGAAFYLGIAPVVRAADAEADAAITKAFADGDAAAGQAALHRPAVLAALAVEDSERVD